VVGTGSHDTYVLAGGPGALHGNGFVPRVRVLRLDANPGTTGQ